MTIIVKIGSQSLLPHDNTDGPALNQQLMSAILQQIALLKQQGHIVYLVSSGAVAAGQRAWSPPSVIRHSKLGETAKRQILAGLGQVELMQTYKTLANKQSLHTVQLLLTKKDFISRSHYLNLERLLLSLQEFPELLPIINENDSISVEELMFTDNDQLAGVLAQQVGADLLCLLTEASGVYDRDPKEPGAKLLSILGAKPGSWPKLQGKSSSGRGGISSKLETAQKMSRTGIITNIAAACEPQILLQVVEQLGQLALNVGPEKSEAAIQDIFTHWCASQDAALGTLAFPPSSTLRILLPNLQDTLLPRTTMKEPTTSPKISSRKPQGLKKWLSARHLVAGHARIFVNEGLAQKLKGEKQAISILPIGIASYEGEFHKGDLIDIYSLDKEKLGIGLARYSCEQLAKIIKKKNQSVFIHYNYLYVENWQPY